MLQIVVLKIFAAAIYAIQRKLDFDAGSTAEIRPENLRSKTL
jgi:hypothetical protein